MNLNSIEDFLTSALNEAELRRLVSYLPDSAALSAGLPGQSTPLAELAHQAVQLLHRQRRLDAAFFNLLIAQVPAREREIRALSDGVSLNKSAQLLRESSPHARVQIRHDEIEGGVGVQVKANFTKDVEIQQRVVRGGTGVLLGDD